MPGQKEPPVCGKCTSRRELNDGQGRGDERLDCSHGVFYAA